MNSVKIIHCADIHIGAAENFLGESAKNRQYETLKTFENIFSLATKTETSLIAISGDLFDSNDIDNTLIDAVFEIMSSYNKIKIVYSAGNHDPLNNKSPFVTRKLPENLFVLKTEDDAITFDDLKLRVYGISFSNIYMKGKNNFSIIPEDDDYINLMVIHGDLSGNLSSDYNSITPDFIKQSKMDYIALGHIHKRSEIGKLANTYFAYCGCPEGQGFDELDSKGVYCGTISKENCSLEFINVSKRKHIYEKIDITGLFNNEEIYKKIISDLKLKYSDNYNQNLYKIELTGKKSENVIIDIKAIIARLLSELYYIKVIDKSTILIDYNTLAQEKSLKGLFVKNMTDKINNADKEQKELLLKALTIGLEAFSSEVTFNED